MAKRPRTNTRENPSAGRRSGKRVSRARSLASRKGWATRRANAEKRSQSAKKGWKTRRKNAAKKIAKKAKPGKSEFAVSADYRASKRGSSVTVQIAAIGPSNATKHDAEAATIHKINTGRSPKGWQIRIVDWRGGEYTGGPVTETRAQAIAWGTLSAPLSLSELSIHKVGQT